MWVVASAPGWAPDSVYVIVPRTATGPVLRTDLTTFNVKTGTTTVVNVILDTRSTPIGGAELSVAYTTFPTVFTSVTPAATGNPAPIVSIFQAGVYRLSLASGSPLSGELAIFRLTFTTPVSNSSGCSWTRPTPKQAGPERHAGTSKEKLTAFLAPFASKTGSSLRRYRASSGDGNVQCTSVVTVLPVGMVMP